MVILFVWDCVEKYGGGGQGRCLCARPCRPTRAHPSFIPRAQCVMHKTYFWYGNAAARTFGRARRRRPYAFCLRELHMNVCPYSFVWADCAWAFDVVCVGLRIGGWFRLGQIVRGCITEMVGMNHRGGRVGACAYSTKPMALAFFMSKAMSGSRSLGTLLSSTASFRVCFNWPTSRHGPR